MQSLLQNSEKITAKQWKAEMQSLQAEYDSISKEQTKNATELAYDEESAITIRTLRGSFRTRADSITDNKARLSGRRKKFNGNLIEI